MVSRSVGAFSHCVFSLDGDTQPTLHDACCEVGRQAEQRDVTWKRVGVPRVSLMPDGRFTSAKIPRSLVFYLQSPLELERSYLQNSWSGCTYFLDSNRNTRCTVIGIVRLNLISQKTDECTHGHTEFYSWQ